MATKTAQPEAATPHERLSAIDAEIAELQAKIEDAAAAGRDAVEYVTRLRSLRDEREPVMRAVANWKDLQEIRRHEATAEEVKAIAATVEAKLPDWRQRFAKMNKAAATLLGEYWALAKELEDATDMHPGSGGPGISDRVVQTITAVATMATRMQEAGYARIRRGESVAPLELPVVKSIVSALDQMPQNLIEHAELSRRRAEKTRRKMEAAK